MGADEGCVDAVTPAKAATRVAGTVPVAECQLDTCVSRCVPRTPAAPLWAPHGAATAEAVHAPNAIDAGAAVDAATGADPIGALTADALDAAPAQTLPVSCLAITWDTEAVAAAASQSAAPVTGTPRGARYTCPGTAYLRMLSCDPRTICAPAARSRRPRSPAALHRAFPVAAPLR